VGTPWIVVIAALAAICLVLWLAGTVGACLGRIAGCYRPPRSGVSAGREGPSPPARGAARPDATGPPYPNGAGGPVTSRRRDEAPG
jgi:hypothetical protein